MKKLSFLIAALLGGGIAAAGTLNVTWTNPTTYTDGSALVPTDITQTKIEYGTCNGSAFGTKAGEAIATGSVTATTITGVAAGNACVRGYTTAKGVESAASNVAAKVVPQAPPSPPVIVTLTTTAYTIGQRGNLYAMVPVGTVALGTPCRANIRIATLNEIPASAVTTTSTAKWFFAKCG